MEVIFRFENKPTNNFLGTDGSSEAVSIFDNGLIRYERFKFNSRKIIAEEEIGPIQEVADKVKAVVEEYANQISEFPDFIDNCCFDGAWQYFQIGTKQICVDNMEFLEDADMETIILMNEGETLERILTSTRQTNIMVDIYRRVARILGELQDK